MEIIDTKNLINGWFIGNFSPSVYKTEQCEVAYKHHFPGEDWPEHYHQHSDEINYLLTGKMEVNGQRMEGPCIFIIKKGEAVKPRFITTVALIVVRVPGIPNDKVIIDSSSGIDKFVLPHATLKSNSSYESHMIYDELGNSIGIKGNSIIDAAYNPLKISDDYFISYQEQVDEEQSKSLKNDLINIICNRLFGKRKKTP